MTDIKQNSSEQTNKYTKDNLSKKNDNIIINNDNQKKYNKVINALKDNENDNKTNNINNDINNNNNKNKIDDNFFKYNFEKSENVGALNNIFLIKNTIGKENIEPMNKFQNRLKNNNIRIKIKPDTNLIESKDEESDKNEENINKNKENKNIDEYNGIKEKKGELDLTYNFDDDVFNVTQEQMKIMDGEVNKIYNKYTNNLKIKNFQINHPYLQYKNINKANNFEFVESHISKEERQKRLSPIIEKQKLILEKIKKDNISRSNVSLSNNNDSSDNQTKNKINKSNRVFYPYKLNQLQKNNGNINISIGNNNNYSLSPNFNSNTIGFNDYNINNNNRYQNLYNNGTLSSDNKRNFSSNDKINLNKSYKRKIIYEPYTLVDYKKKYNNNIKLLGGLGANIGGEEWVYRQKQLERKKQYSEFVKNDNEEDFKKFNKKKTKLKNENNEITKTVSSKKSSVFSSNGKINENIYNKNIIKTENNIRNSKQIKLPLIMEKFKNNISNNNNNKINLKQNINNSKLNKKYQIKESNEYEILNPINPINGNEKDLKELIRQYEEYNKEFKL